MPETTDGPGGTIENTATTAATPEGDISDATPERSDSGSEPDTGDDVDETTTATAEPDAEQDDRAEPQSKREARYRTQLRETEAQRDQLAARIEAMQRAEAERLAADVIAQPNALWVSGTTLPDLLDDDGQLDPAKVDTAARAAQQTLGLELGAAERKKKGPIVPREGASTRSSAKSNTWADAFK